VLLLLVRQRFDSFARLCFGFGFFGLSFRQRLQLWQPQPLFFFADSKLGPAIPPFKNRAEFGVLTPPRAG